MTRHRNFRVHKKVQLPNATLSRSDWRKRAHDWLANSLMPPGGRKMPMHYTSVFIVDDDPVFRTTLEAFLVLHGTKNVLHASEGAEAYASLSKGQSIDLIILDLNMPELNGIEFLALLKENKLNVPLLVISSAAAVTIKSAEALAKVYGLNFLGAMSKPVDFDELRTVLQLTKKNS